MITQYYSKWRNEWIDFSTEVTPGTITAMEKYFYKLR